MDNPTPDTIFTALFIGSMIIAIYILTRIHIKRAYEAAHKPIYRWNEPRYSTWQYTTYEINRDCLGSKAKGPMATKR